MPLAVIDKNDFSRTLNSIPQPTAIFQGGALKSDLVAASIVSRQKDPY